MKHRQLDEEAIFHIAQNIADSEAQAGYLNQVFPRDRLLRERVEALRSAHEKEQDFLKSAEKPVASTVDQHAAIEIPGMSIGRYNLMEQIPQLTSTLNTDLKDIACAASLRQSSSLPKRTFLPGVATRTSSWFIA